MRAAHAINDGEPPPTTAGVEDVRDFFLVEREGAPADRSTRSSRSRRSACPRTTASTRAPTCSSLAPMHRGPVGVDALNAELRARLNPDGAAIPGTSLRVGDRVIQTATTTSAS